MRTRVYDASTGLVTSETDANNSVTTSYTYDYLGRRRTVNEAGLRTTTTDYDDLRRVVTTTSALDSSHNLKTASTFDWLGRTVLTRKTADDGTQPDAADTTSAIRTVSPYLYPSTADGYSYQLASNPYVTGSEESMGWTRAKLDQMGRAVEVTTYSGSAKPAPWGANTSSTGSVTTAYNADATTVTDQASKVRVSYVDALGRLVQVVEDPSWLNYQTSYRYDTLDDLAGVCQGGTFSGTTCSGTQSRTFTYSSLGRLVSAGNPEICGLRLRLLAAQGTCSRRGCPPRLTCDILFLELGNCADVASREACLLCRAVRVYP
jgi:hypothetical protein